MDHLHSLVKGLSKEQTRFYKLFAGRTIHSHDRKDLKLFEFLRKNSPETSDEILLKKLYPDETKNAWYRLRNRLLTDLNKSLTILHYEDDDFIHCCHMLALYRYFINRNQLQEAKFYLRRAEKNAAAIENYELLDIVFGEYIRLSHETLQINPEVYIEKRKKNREALEGLRAIDDLLAVVTYRLKTTQNFSQDKNPLLDLLKKYTDDFIKDRDLKNSPVLRFRIYQAVSQILLQRHEYESLEIYLLKTYQSFDKDNLFNRGNHDTKLQMLTYIVNTLFKNNRQKLSLAWAEKLHSAMDEFHHMLYDKYFFFYYNALVINYSKLDPDKALEILNDLKDNPRIKSNSFYHLFVYLNLAVLKFDRKDYKESVKYFTRIFLLDGYKTADRSLRFKIAICELITRFELESYDVFEYKLAQLKKDFKDLLADDSHEGEKRLIGLLLQMMDPDSLSKNSPVRKSVEAFIVWIRKERDADSLIIDYGSWLEEKLKLSGMKA